jgi:hypothetical protein
VQPPDLRERWQLSADDWGWIRGDLQRWRRGRPGTQFRLLITAVEAICRAERFKQQSRQMDRLVAHSERLAIDPDPEFFRPLRSSPPAEGRPSHDGDETSCFARFRDRLEARPRERGREIHPRPNCRPLARILLNE